LEPNVNTEQYSVSLNSLGIQRNLDPFPLDPPKEVDYWADNKNILKKMIQAQIDSMMFASSFMYIVYGPVGVGKTFAVKYLANPETQKLIAGTIKRPNLETFSIRVSAVMPMRAGQLTFSIHKDIVTSCFSTILKDQTLIRALLEAKDTGTGKTRAAFEDIGKQMRRKTLENTVSTKDLEKSEGFKFLVQEKSSIGKVQDTNELVETIKILVGIFSKKYERVIISLDELEMLRRSTQTERSIFSDFLRKLNETIENSMTIFLIFTFETFEDVEQVLQPALLSRVKDSIEFPFIKSKTDVKQYITECILLRSKIEPEKVIEEEAVDEIASSLLANFRQHLTFRIINNEMHRIFTSTYLVAEQPQKYKITLDLYRKAMKSTRVEDVVRQLSDFAKQGDTK
jgi:Cdc6-like AAA superfamily ATPase